MTTTTTGVDHGVTITEVQLPAGAPLRAECLCGFGSALATSRTQAAALGQAHLDIVHKMEAHQAQSDEWEANEPTVIPPCPSWCRFTEVVAGVHDYDSVQMADFSTYTRFHVSGQDGVDLAQEERNRDGVVTFGPVHITISERDGCEETTAEQARHLAAELLAAADELDRINTTEGPRT